MITGNIPDEFDELDCQQRLEFARLGFKLLKMMIGNKDFRKKVNETACKISEQVQEVQRILNSCSVKVK